ncbi:MAG: MATE family efflux transporter, partial [Bacteroidales bacterium]|nr:MATE family efflux transporter [Bacteroidales bacterium]
MTTTYKYSQIWTIAYPILLSTLMEQLIGMTDTAFLGRVGEIELGASALGGIFYVTVFMLGLGFSIGAQILMARRNGEGKY